MFFQYPYTDLYSLNLDWLIKSMREVQEKIEQDRGERVLSFNTRTGTVTLLASDVNALGINSVAVVPSISGMSADAISAAYESGVRILLEGSAGNYTKAGFMVAADEGIDICMLSVDMSPIQNQIDAIQDKVNPETAAAGNVFTIDAQGNSAWLPPDATETDALKAKLNKVVPTVGASHALIPALSYFYYNGQLRTANVDIAADAAITDTNSSIVTDAGLSDVLNNAMSAFSQLDEQINPEGGGTPGQFLQVDSEGATIWGPPATEAAIGAAVTSWLGTNVPTGTTVVVDRSLTVADAAADAKVTGDEIRNLKSALKKSNEIGYLPIAAPLERGWINTSGTNSASNYALRTVGYIDVKSGDVIQIYLESSNYFTTVKTYNANKEIIANLFSTETLPPDTDYIIPDNVKYIRYAVDSSNHSQYVVQSNSGGVQIKTEISKRITEIENDSNNFATIVKRFGNALTNDKTVDITNEFTFEDGYILNINGRFVSTASEITKASSTDYLDIYQYSDLYITGAPLYTSNCLYALYDADKTFLGSYKNNTVETDYHFYFNNIIVAYPNARYARFSSIKNGTYDLYIKRPSYLSDIITDSLKWSGKKWVCIGDSLTEANSRTTKHYYDYISENTGITVVINAGSGSGYKNPSSVDNKTFYQRATEIPIDADVVTIFGSGNDLTHSYTLGNVSNTGTDTICGCINTTIDNLIARIPTIQLGIIAPTPWVNFPPSTSGNAMELYVEALQTICKNRSIPFLDLYHCSNLRPWTAEGRTACYSKDNENGVHPDETGHKIIAPRLEGFLDFLLI